MRRAGLLLALLLLTGCGGGSDAAAAPEEPLLVAAASDLQPAFEQLGEDYTAQTGRAVTFTFGSSGQLAQQIENGAPYDVFASASVGYVEDVVAAGQADAATQADYALGRLAVWTSGAAGSAPVTLEQLVEPRFRRIAIANPEHAPYGVAAQQALRSTGVLPVVQDRLVLGESVSDTLRLATSGNADAAVVALSLARARDTGVFSEVPASAHAPLRQAVVVTADGDRADPALAFVELVTGPQGRDVLTRSGFAPPAG